MKSILVLLSIVAVISCRTVTAKMMAVASSPPQPCGITGATTLAVPDCSGNYTSDCTEPIQTILNNPNISTICFTEAQSPYITLPLVVSGNYRAGGLSPINIVFESPQVLLLAKRWAFNATGASLLTINGVLNASVIGNGATMRMWKFDYANPKYYAPAQWRMGIQTDFATNFLVQNLTIELTGGDGIYVGVGNKNITVQHVTSRFNYRQGMSVIDVDGLYVSDSIFESTNGTAPQGGVDIEPNTPFQKSVNMHFKNCIFRNNSGAQFYLSLHAYNASSAPVSLTIEDCIFDAGGGMADFLGAIYLGMAVDNYTNAPDSGALVTMRRNTLMNTHQFGLWMYGKPASHVVYVEGLTIINNTQPDPAIYLERFWSPENTFFSQVLMYNFRPEVPVMLVIPSSGWNVLAGNIGIANGTVAEVNPEVSKGISLDKSMTVFAPDNYGCQADQKEAYGNFPIRCFPLLPTTNSSP